jgi:hypothetical protein
VRVADFERSLVERGLIAPDAPPLPFGAAGRPWFVSLVMGAAGWLASLFAFLFIVLFFDMNSEAAAAMLGLVMVGVGLGLYRIDSDNAFFEQLALSLTLAGQLALIYAVADTTHSETLTAAFTAAMSVVMVLLLPNAFARTLSTLFACLAWAVTVRFAQWGENWFDGTRQAVGLAPALLGWLVIWLPVGVTTEALIRGETRWMASGLRAIARPALTGLLVALSLGTWGSEPFATLTFWAPSGGVPRNWLALWPFLGIGAALFAAVCAYRLRHTAMLGVAIAGALTHVVQFYYLLGVTLVMKSWIMIAMGVVLLLGARRLRLHRPMEAP